MKLAVNSKKETNSRVKMDKGSRWVSVIYPLKKSKWGCCCLSPDRVKLIVNSKKETKSRVKMGKGSKWAKSQNGPRVKMGFCYLHPERVKMGCCCLPPARVRLTVNSKKKQTAGSKWERVKMGQQSRWASIIYP